MDCQILAVREVSKGLRIAHVSAAGLFGEVPAADDVKQAGAGVLRIKLVCRDGRLGASVRVERKG